jgi:hypothetical protein
MTKVGLRLCHGKKLISIFVLGIAILKILSRTAYVLLRFLKRKESKP